jgi:hypothetical protein
MIKLFEYGIFKQNKQKLFWKAMLIVLVQCMLVQMGKKLSVVVEIKALEYGIYNNKNKRLFLKAIKARLIQFVLVQMEKK